MEGPKGYTDADFANEVANNMLSADPENTENLRAGMILEFTSPQDNLRIQTSLETTITAGEALKLICVPDKKKIFFRRTKDNKAIMDPDGKAHLFTAGEICTLIKAGTMKINQ